VEIIDTHCHIEQDEFDIDRKQVIPQCKQVGVWMITSAITPNSWKKAIEIGKEFDNVEVAIGLDPMKWDKLDDAALFIEKNENQIVAIGEVGLDHYIVRNHDDREKQESAFRKMIMLSNNLNLPIQIHSRSAGRRAIKTLSDMDAKNVHMHAFDGKSSLARMASKDLGYYFSIPPSVVRSPQKKKLVKAVDIERLMVETDSPVLGPFKGVRNVPMNIEVAIREIASILHRGEDEILSIVLENSLGLYKRIKDRF